MAFFEFLASIGETLSSTLGKFIKPVGGRGLGNYVPSPKTNPPLVSNQTADVVGLDKAGSWVNRSQALSDEGSFGDDFPGSSLTTALTGTPTFTNGQVAVSGAGTAFLTELSTDSYIKRDSDVDSAWARVARVLSDTSLELASAYTGTSGGSASSSSNWIRTIGSGGSIAVGSGELTIASGTTSSSITRINRSVDFIPLSFKASVRLSQRVANQSFFLGFRDSVSSATNAVGITFDGTTNTTVKFRCQNGTAGSEIAEYTVTLPFGLTTATELSYKVDVTPRAATLTVNGAVISRVNIRMPAQYTELSFVAESNNTGVPSGSTNFILEDVQIQNYNQLQIGTIATADPVPVQFRDEIHYISGVLTSTATTADQTILSYTVPTGQILYIIGYMVSTDGNTDGLPVKIGKNTITTEPAAPGTLDSVIFRMFRMTRSGTSSNPIVNENFTVPRLLGYDGDVVKMTVTPSGTGSTKWRGTIEFILRPGS